MKLLCDVYKSRVEDDLYLYVPKQRGLDGVPPALLEKFGPPLPVMTMVLHPGRKLARADVVTVIENLESRGFYLQMPAQKETYMQEINTFNSKLQQ